MFSSHPSAGLEYWFFKLNQGTTSLLVDWIARRRAGTMDLRISIHSDHGSDVVTESVASALDQGPAWLSSMSSTHDDGDIRWNLSFSATAARIRPGLAIAERLGTFDLSYESAPELTFNGWIEYRGVRHDVANARGMAAHYWGPRLMPEWWWMSANQFDGDTTGRLAVECSLNGTSLWGSRLKTHIGYFWINDGRTERLLIHPPARIKVSGDLDAISIAITSLRGPRFKLVGTGRNYADLGDDILNTSTGDLEVWRDDILLGKAVGTASLERHAPGLVVRS